MKTSIKPETLEQIGKRLAAENIKVSTRYPGDRPDRQPVHSVYGGAQLFKADTARKMGAVALKALDEYAPDAASFFRAVDAPVPSDLARKVYDRVREKLSREAVEDFRIDFEDGFGIRPDAEEDSEAVRTAGEVARGFKEKTLPPFIGIRIKPLNEELRVRSLRTLDLFVTALVDATDGRLPSGFVVTLPKITHPSQVASLARALRGIEEGAGLPDGVLKMEFMIEVPQSLYGPAGEAVIPTLIQAAEGRAVAAHFGTYDYTASLNITASQQAMDHPVCDFAKHIMQVQLAGSGLWISDGATNVMPVGSRESVHGAWRLSYSHIRHSLAGGFYQGWDLHPAQLPVRYAACYAFFLEGLEAASARLKNFIEKAAQATLVGDVFDDAATGQGLLNYFLRAMNCGAITTQEIAATGLTLEEVRTRSFLRILEGRKRR